MTVTESGEVNYYCPHCHNLVLITEARGARVRAVYCRSCKARVTVYLAGEEEARTPAARGGVQVVGTVDPRNPPIEAGPVRPIRGRG